MARRVIDFELLGNVILVAMYEEFVNDGKTQIWPTDLSEIIREFPKNAIALRLRELSKFDNINQVMEQDSNDMFTSPGNVITGRITPRFVETGRYYLTRDGINEIGQWPEDTYNSYLAHTTFSTMLDTLETEPDDVPLDIWEPLPVDRSSPAYEEATDALDKAIEAIEGNNGYARSEPNERNQIVESLKEGRRLLKEHLPSRDQLQAMILQPLNFMARKFAATTMGEIAKAAAAKILVWITGLF